MEATFATCISTSRNITSSSVVGRNRARRPFHLSSSTIYRYSLSLFTVSLIHQLLVVTTSLSHPPPLFAATRTGSSSHQQLMWRQFGRQSISKYYRDSPSLYLGGRQQLVCRRKRFVFCMSSSSNMNNRNMNHSNDNKIRRNSIVKDIWIIRHGQAEHNVRAEYARNVQQCSHDEFLAIMEQDDAFDAPLTKTGIQEAQHLHARYGNSHLVRNSDAIGDGRSESSSTAYTGSKLKQHVELVVSSPLSRALQTAELVLGDDECSPTNNIGSSSNSASVAVPNRVCYEGFREINGWLLNGKRRSRNELNEKFPKWDFSLLSSNDDTQWTTELETTTSCMERGYNGLRWMMNERSERSIVLVAHGALLKYTLTEHPNVILRDGRKQPSPSPPQPQRKKEDDYDEETLRTSNRHDQQTQKPLVRCIRERYHNCEIRRYRMELGSDDVQQPDEESSSEQHIPSIIRSVEDDNVQNELQQHRDIIILTEVDL